MPAKKNPTLKAGVEELETLVDRLKGKRDEAIINIVRGQDLTDAEVNELQEEQEHKTKNMGKMHDQFERVIRVGEDLKIDVAILKNKILDDVQIKAKVIRYLKERTTQRLNAFFIGMGYTATIVAGAVIITLILKAVL